MVVWSLGLLLLGPAVLVGMFVARRRNRLLTFLTMMVVFVATNLIWGAPLSRLVTGEGLVILIAHILVSLLVADVSLPLLSRLTQAHRIPSTK
jgi:Na+/proline symporter